MKDPYLLVLFYSASGNVRGLAHAIANGAEYEGLPTKLRTVNRISREGDEIGEEIICTKEELVNCSGLALGSPTRFGSMAAPLKYFLDQTGDLWSNNALENKPGIAFTSTGSMHGGQELTIMNLITFMFHHGMLILGSPYSIKEMHSTKGGGTPYGPSSVSGNQTNLTNDEKIIAEKSGGRIARFILNKHA